MNQLLFDILITTFFFECLILLVIGTLYVIEQAIIEVFNYDILKVIKERINKNVNK